MNEELIPDGLKDIYRHVYTSADQVADERVNIALLAVLSAMNADVRAAKREAREHSIVVKFKRPEAPEEIPGLARSR